MSAYAAENRLRKWFTGDVHTKKIQQATSKKWDDHIAETTAGQNMLRCFYESML